MNFYQNFKELSHVELKNLLQNPDLNYDAKLQLKKVLEESNNPDFDQDLYQLNQEIEDENNAVLSLKYLQNIGFSFKNEGGTIEIKRHPKTKRIDILGILLGVFFCFYYSQSALSNWKEIVTKGISGGNLLGAGMSTALVILGFLLISKCLERFLIYRKFSMIKNANKEIAIKKNTRFGIFDDVIPSDHLRFGKKNDYHAISFLDNQQNEVVLFQTNAGPRSKATLESLFTQLQS